MQTYVEYHRITLASEKAPTEGMEPCSNPFLVSCYAHILQESVAKPAVPLGLKLLDHGDDFFDESMLLCQHQQAQQSRHGKSVLHGQTTAKSLVDQERVRMELQRECDGLGLASVQSSVCNACWDMAR